MTNMISLKSCAFFLIVLVTGYNGYGQLKKVWALGESEKVYRLDPEHPDKNGNITWDGKKIHLTGLYNEVLAFQVIAELGKEGASMLDVSVSYPVNNKRQVIGGSSQRYGNSGTVEVFSEHYLKVVHPTLPNWYFGSKASAPSKMTGWIPDALIPSNAMPGRGGLPLSVPPIPVKEDPDGNILLQNQGFWIDIYLPGNRNQFEPGLYTGSISVSEKGKVFATIPLEVELLPYRLPDSSNTHVWLFTESVNDYFPGLDSLQVERLLKFEGHRHRIDVTGGFPANTRPFDKALMTDYKPYLNGDAYTQSHGYHGPGQGVGEHLFPIGTYGSPVLGDSREQVQTAADKWVNWFHENAPNVTYFWYMTDEPTAGRYPWVKERASWISSDPGAGKALPKFTTTAYNPSLADDIDIFAGYDGADLKVLKTLREKGGDHWFYNGNRPRYGSVILEAAGVDFRVNEWLMYKYDLDTWFIWNGTHWQHNGQGPKRHLHQEVFENPLTFINDSLEFGNGDGIIFYPGRMPFYPDEDRGLNELLPSIRLKNIRRGQQDAALMELVEKKAGRENVISVINSIVPKGMTEVAMDQAVPWSQKGNDYDRARLELLKLLQ